ncbi:RNA polymerase sigma-54 factor [Planctomycetales bacterium]|nr:RNA polymerase sigma-54 factor [Planctomycetales bacterium]
MRLTFGQELRQEQRQILTQRMIHSMEILQLTLQQLEERIEQETEENPVLELVQDNLGESSGIINPADENLEKPFDTEGDNEESEMSGGDSAIIDSGMDSGILSSERAEMDAEFIEPEMRIENESISNSLEEFSIADEFSQNYSGTIDEEPVRSQGYLDEMDEQQGDQFANIPGAGGTFQSYLEEQFTWFEISDELHEMAWRIINNLDTKGYFTYDLPDFLGENYTPEELSLAEEALAFVRELDPAGVAAKDLRDCLLLQLNNDSPNVDLLRIIITSYLEEVSLNKIPAIARATGFPIDKIQEAIAELKHRFNPLPSSGFGNEMIASIIPDVIVDINEKGEYTVKVANERIPKLRINRLYRSLIKDQHTDKETKEYIRKKVDSAKWLIDAIEQRHSTLLKVSNAILKHQIDFFRIGPQAIRPLKMQQIADEIGIHITTVSRACDEKWMQSPQGVYPLRRFFVTGLETGDGGETVANDVVQIKIREIINGEDKNDPLSDDKIVKILEEDGIKLARRTVVKYRQNMKIPSSRGRKTWTMK